MQNITRKLNVALGRHLPARRIFLKSDAGTRYFELSPIKQFSLGSLALLGGSWSLVATAALLLNSFQADNAQNQTRVLQDAYEARIAALTAERDQSLFETKAAGDRFSIALAQVSAQQSDMLGVIGEQNVLATELDLMRAKFAVAINARDAAVTQNLQLAAANASLTKNPSSANPADLTNTLQTISLALSETIVERDSAEMASDTFEAQIAGLQLKMKINAERQDRMMARLEEAVTVSFAPLEGMFEAAGLDVGRIVGDVQLTNSGTGGPLTPFVSSKGEGALSLMEQTALTTDDRLQNLLHDIDAVNSLQIAAEGLPFSIPVDGPYRNTSGFGGRADPKGGGWRMHNGLDFAGSVGTDIVAAGDGTVVFAGLQSGFGNMIKVRHSNGYESVYAHLSAINVDVGDHVSRGDHIGDMGNTGRSTGTHLHYEIRLSGNPLNPMTFLEAARNVL